MPMNNGSFAPITLFVYKRLDHTRRTVEALLKNELAEHSDLFVFSDGSKNDDDNASVTELRKYLKDIKGFKSVTVYERETNIGLAANIIDGVTRIVNQYGKIIVIEDDIVTGKYFLKYMNDALAIYGNSNRVMEISGMSYPMDKTDLPETMFLHYGDCWGWATWKRAWDKFEKNPKKLMKEFSIKDIYHFNLENRDNRWNQVIFNRLGIMNTWAVFWDATIYKDDGLMLFPRESLVQNIGLDNTGEHVAKSNPLNIPPSNEQITFFPDVEEIYEDPMIRDRFANCQLELSKKLQQGVFKKACRHILKLMKLFRA